jgi:hypothetical protein
MYYGNSSAASTSDGFNTFVFFDDFDDSSFDTGKWTVSGTGSTITESNGVLTFTIASNSRWIYSAGGGYANAYSLRARAKMLITTGTMHLGFLTPTKDTQYEKYLTGAFRFLSSDTNFTGNSGNETNPSSPDMGVVKDANYHITEARRYVSGATNYDRFTINDGEEVAGTYPTTVSRQVVISNRGTSGDSFVTDWVALRNYALSEPTVTAWGSLEFVPGASTLNFGDILMQGVNLPSY